MRRLTILWVLAALAAAARAEAGIDQWIGRTIADVRLEVAGRPFDDPAVLSLVETRVGEPLSMAAVRDTIEHLVGLGRFDDIRVTAAPAAPGVALTWHLLPVQTIDLGRLTLEGTPGLSLSSLRAEITERFGADPPATRLDDMVRAVTAYYDDRGYPAAKVEGRLVDSGTPGRPGVALTIAAGPRTEINQVSVVGNPPDPAPALMGRLGIERGRAFDRPALADRMADYEDGLRAQGFYEARVGETHVVSEDGRTVSLTITVTTGPHVRVVFEGDPLPAGDREALVPIREERSADLDLLEDASRNIEAALRREGYRAAQAPYSRAQTDTELVLTFTVTRGPLHRIGAVTLAGGEGLDRSEVEPLVALKPGDPFADARVSAVAGAITELYRVNGFAGVTVTPNVQVLPSDTRGGVQFRPVDVRFDIAEGPRTVVGDVSIAGASALSDTDVRALLGLTEGRPFYRPQLAVDRETVERAYHDHGYQSATATPALSFADDGSRADVAWTVREGPQFHVDHILITGNSRTSIDVIRRELALAPGDPVTDPAIAESQRRLAALGLFRRVRITELPRSGETDRDILVEVEEAPATTISYGGGIEVGRIGRASEVDGVAEDQLDVAPRAFFDITRRNLWGKNRSISLFARVTLRERQPGTDAPEGDTGGYGFNDYRGYFSFREPRAFGTTGDAQFTAFLEQGLRTSFNFNRKGVAADYARRIGHFTVTGRYTFDTTRLFDEQIAPEDQLLIDRLFPQVRLSKIFGGVLRDSRDDVLDPQRGAVVGLDGTMAARWLGSEVGFLKTFAQGFLYRRVPGHRVVIAMGARLGLAVGIAEAEGVDPAAAGEPIRDLPASERFFAGGDTTVRGFALDRLGTPETLDPQGFPQGGNGMAIFNLEARAPYWKNLQFVWFADAGNVFRRATDIRLDELRATSGFGFRYRSPIGPLRVDWGVKLSSQLTASGGRERGSVLHISLGQAF